MSLLDASRFTTEAEGEELLSPCMALTLFLQRVDEPGIIDFYERALAAVGGLLSHSCALSGRWRKLDTRTREAVPLWKGKMHKVEVGLMCLLSSSPGTGAAAIIDIFVSPPPYLDPRPAKAAAEQAAFKRIHERGNTPAITPAAVLRVCLPTSHELVQDPDRLVSWVNGFELVRRGLFSFGSCGYALNQNIYLPSELRGPAAQRLDAICQQFPGFDFHLPLGSWFLYRYEPEKGQILHKAKRASWLTLLSGNCVEQLGGRGPLEKAAKGGGVSLSELEQGAVLLRAGAQAGVGEVARRDLLPEYRRVARAIRPVRLESLRQVPSGSSRDWVQDWLEFFDREPL